MILDVTQDIVIRITPVNNPRKFNKCNEQMGYYRAYVMSSANDSFVLRAAEDEIYRGIVPMSVGYGHAATPTKAAAIALEDYADKFGAICTTDTEEQS